VYDTTYIQVTASTSEEMKMGLIGQEITIIETNYLNILNVETIAIWIASCFNNISKDRLYSNWRLDC